MNDLEFGIQKPNNMKFEESVSTFLDIKKVIAPLIHCKCLQGITGLLQGNHVTGTFYLQGHTWHEIANNNHYHFNRKNYVDLSNQHFADILFEIYREIPTI